MPPLKVSFEKPVQPSTSFTVKKEIKKLTQKPFLPTKKLIHIPSATASDTNSLTFLPQPTQPVTTKKKHTRAISEMVFQETTEEEMPVAYNPYSKRLYLSLKKVSKTKLFLEKRLKEIDNRRSSPRIVKKVMPMESFEFMRVPQYPVFKSRKSKRGSAVS